MAFFNFNTDSRISLCVRAQYLKYVKDTHQGHQIAFSNFKVLNLLEKNNNFAEFKVPLIHRKQVPLLHNTVLILWDEGAGLVAVIMHILLMIKTKKSVKHQTLAIYCGSC